MLALALSACGGPTRQAPPPLTVDVGVPPLLAAPLYVLAERRPDLLRLRTVTAATATADLASGRATGAVVGPEEVTTSRPAIAAVARLEPSWLLGRQPDPNFIWTSLTSRLVLAASGPSGQILRWAFQQHHLSPDRQLLTGLGPLAFAEGSGDFLQAIPPFPKLRAQPVAAVGLEAGPLLRAVLVGGGPAARRDQLATLAATGEDLLAGQPEEAIPALQPALPSANTAAIGWAVHWGARVRLWPRDPRLSPTLIRRTRLVLGKRVLPDDGIDFGPGDRAYLHRWPQPKKDPGPA